jgi:hypothetical protein
VDCSRFQAELVELLASGDGLEHGARVRELRLHAEGCTTCSTSRDLLDWAALDASEREPDPDPGEAYWDEFQERLQRRIVRQTRRRRTRSLGLLAAAAVVGLAVVGIWVLRPDPEPSWVKDERVLVELEHALDAFDGWDGFDLEAADGDLALQAEGALFPAIDDLDDESRQRLLDWVREQESALDGGAV